MNKVFKKPTPSEVTEYAKTIGYDLDGEYFCDWYETRGWMAGRNKMKSWRAAVRTWKYKDEHEFHRPAVAADSQKPLDPGSSEYWADD